MQINNKKGFTLVELMVVMALIAVLSTLIIGAIRLATNTARETTHRSNSKSISTGLEAKYAKYRAYCGGSTGVTCSGQTNANIGSGGTATFQSAEVVAPMLGIDISQTSECTVAANAGGAVVHIEVDRYIIRPLDSGCTDTIADGAGTFATTDFDKNNDIRVGY
jgi:prepilin-type N-terminal cleavage/methylation domain-containing protein